MSLAVGTQIVPHEIVAPLGQGGMGEVDKVRDTKLDRDVALKLLPESLAADSDRLMRFEREAKTLASLNHPNTAAIHGIEEAGTLQASGSAVGDSPTLTSPAATQMGVILGTVARSSTPRAVPPEEDSPG